MSILAHTELYTVNNICSGCGGKVTVCKNLDGFTAECYSNKCIDSAINDENYTCKYEVGKFNEEMWL